MPTKSALLANIRLQELLAFVDRHGLQVGNRRERGSATRALANCSKAPDEKDLLGLSKDRLKSLCIALDEDDSGVKKDLIARLLPTDKTSADTDAVLYATRSNESGARPVEVVSLAKMAEMAKKADSVEIYSAYYSIEALKEIVGKSKGATRVVVNRLRGRRLEEQVKELRKELVKETGVEVRLARSDRLFHTKLYLFRTRPGRPVAWIGSANATKAGLDGHNEEILIRLDPAPMSVLDYAADAWNRATPLDDPDIVNPVNSLVDFFRTGTLYYEPHANLRKSYNPFTPLWKVLSDEEKTQISRVQPDFAGDADNGVPPFSIQAAFEVDNEPISNVSRTVRVTTRQNSVETAYGCWVAEPCVASVDKNLDEAAKSKHGQLKRMGIWVEHNEKFILNSYREYCEKVRNDLEDIRIQWRRRAREENLKEKEIDRMMGHCTDMINKTREHVLAELSDTQIERHCNKFVWAPVPEIWNDDNAQRWFEESFFESLAYSASKEKRYGSSRRILEAVYGTGVDRELDPKQIRDDLESRLQDSSWYRDVFLDIDYRDD